VHQQVRHPVADQVGQHHRVGPAGDHRQVRPPAAVIGGADLARHPVHRPGHPVGPARPHVRGCEATRGGVGRDRHPGVSAAHPGDAGRGQERGDAGADPARAVDPGKRRPAAGEHRRPAVAVPVGKRGAGQFGRDPLKQIPGQGGAQPGREVVEHPGRGQQAEHPVHRRLADAVDRGGPDHLVGIA
jgi:hypothetical protein